MSFPGIGIWSKLHGMDIELSLAIVLGFNLLEDSLRIVYCVVQTIAILKME
jgi:hypothetical protein